jgi:LPS sulfotransferase NodH
VSGGPPIFVVGFQRSGTTLLQSLIGSHPRIAAPPETYFLFRIARLADHYGDLAVDEHLRRALHDALNPPMDIFAECGFDEDVVFARASRKPRTMRGLFEAIMEDFSDRNGKARWSDKSPGQTASEVHKMFPDAQVVHIIREPRDVIASSLETPWTRANAFDLACNWRTFTSANIWHGRLAGPERYLQVRYEELAGDPSGVMSRVCAFLGEEFDERLLTELDRRRATVVSHAALWQSRALGPVESSRDGGWKERLSRKDQLVIEAVVAGDLAALGYATPLRRRQMAGAALGLPPRTRRWLRDRRARRLARDPRWRERRTKEFLEEQAALVRASRGAAS